MKFNPRSRIKVSTCSLLLTFILFFIPVSLMALSSDRSQPIDLEADSADIDDLKGISIYTGNVILTQGSMVIKSSKLTLYTNKDRELEKAIAVGSDKKLASSTMSIANHSPPSSLHFQSSLLLCRNEEPR